MFLMSLSLISRIFISASFCLIGSACGAERTYQYLESPNGKYTLEIKHDPGAAMSSSTLWVSIARGSKNDAEDFEEIFFGRASPQPEVKWSGNEFITIRYCDGYIFDLNTPFYDKEARQRIHVHVANVPGLFVNGQQMCSGEI